MTRFKSIIKKYFENDKYLKDQSKVLEAIPIKKYINLFLL